MYTLPKGGRLEDILSQHKGATILVFYADWCGPCRDVKPHIQRRASKLPESSTEKFPRVIRINMDHHHDLADKYAVFSIPCMVLVKDGRPVEYVNSADRDKISELFYKAEVIGYA